MANAATTNFGSPNQYLVVTDNLGVSFLIDQTSKRRWRITGSGQMTHAQTMFGQARTTDANGQRIYLTGYAEGPSVVDLYGGPGGIDAVARGEQRDPLTGQFFTSSAPATPTQGAGTTQTGSAGSSSAPTVVVTAPTPNSPGGSNTTNPDYITNPPVSGGNGAPIVQDIPTAAPVNFADLAAALYPWMPKELLDIFVAEWNRTGDERIAWGKVRTDPKYDVYFPGNRRDDGTFRYSESEYLAVKDGYRQVLADIGVNPDVFESRFSSLIAGDVSLNEFEHRVHGIQEGILGNSEAIKQWYASNYGIELTDAAIVASALDPQVGRDILDRRIAVSQVGGEAARFGFARSVGQADRLVAGGVTQQGARELYARAGAELPTFQALSTRFRDPDSTFDLTEFEDASVFLDPGQLRRIRGLLGRERSLFSPQGNVRRDREGLLSGLLPR